MSQSTFIHIGFSKCASTLLQEDFFTQCPQIEYLGRTKKHKGQGKHKYLTQLATLDNYNYTQKKHEIIHNIKSAFASCSPDKVAVVSDEALVASSYSPYLIGIPRADRQSLAERLHDVFPDAHIVMIIRNQMSFYGSMLGQLMRNNETSIRDERFTKLHLEYLRNGYGSFFLMADYCSVYRIYESLFGKDNVHVILFEDLIKDPPGFVKRLTEMMGISDKIDVADYALVSRNKRATRFEIWCKSHPKLMSVLRGLTPGFVRRILDRVSQIHQIWPTLSSEQEEFLRAQYSPGNRELAELTGLDLATAGYPMES